MILTIEKLDQDKSSREFYTFCSPNKFYPSFNLQFLVKLPTVYPFSTSMWIVSADVLRIENTEHHLTSIINNRKTLSH